MRKLEFLNLANFLKIIIVLLLSFVPDKKLAAQEYQCNIDTYLVPFKASMHSGWFRKTGIFNKDFSTTKNYAKKININGSQYPFLLRDYKLSDNIVINVGKAKVKKDSLFYFNANIYGINNYYYIRKPCSIKLIGYRLYKDHEMQLYFKLLSKNCVIIFSVGIFKSNIQLNQYDSQ
jgi:hypothetical protein